MPGHVDGVGQAGVRVAPIPLQGFVHPHGVAAGAGEDLVDGHHRAPHRTDLGAPPGRAIGERDLLAGVDDVVDAVGVGQDLLAGGVDVGGGLADRVHHVRVVLDRGAGRTDPLALVVQVRGQRALGDADGGRGDAQREHRRPRHQVQGLGHAGLALGGSVHHLERVHGAVGGHERVAHDDVLGAGAPQAHHIPRVLDDLVVLARQNHVQHLRRHDRLAFGVAEQGTEEDPLAVVGARAELPAAVEDVPAVDRLATPCGAYGEATQVSTSSAQISAATRGSA